MESGGSMKKANIFSLREKNAIKWFFQNPRTLTLRECKVMETRFDDQSNVIATLEEVAKTKGIERVSGDKTVPLTRGRIKQIQTKAIRKLIKRSGL